MFYLQTAEGDKVVKTFKQAIEAVYDTQGLAIADLVLRGTNEDGEYLYDSENGWVFDNLQPLEIEGLKQAFKHSSHSLRLVVGQ